MIWKPICRKGGHYDKGEILDRTLEQFAFAGTGHPRSDLHPRRIFQFILVHKGWNDRDCAYRGALLNSYRRTYRHAVRVASGKLS